MIAPHWCSVLSTLSYNKVDKHKDDGKGVYIVLDLDDSGAIQIPEDVRSWLGIKPGDLVEILAEDGAIIIYLHPQEPHR